MARKTSTIRIKTTRNRRRNKKRGLHIRKKHGPRHHM